MTKFTVLIITNAKSDLSKLKFPEFNIVNVKSEEFEDFVKKTKISTDKFLKEINDNFQIDEKQRYAIINKELTQKFGSKKIHDAFNFLLLLFPSNLSVEYIVGFKFENKHLECVDGFRCDILSEEPESFLVYDELEAPIINDFIKDYSQKFLDIGYLESSIQNYLNAFNNQYYYHFTFIALCISLERKHYKWKY